MPSKLNRRRCFLPHALPIRRDSTWYCYGWDLTKNICEIYSTGGYIKTAYTYTPYGLVASTGSVTQAFQWSSEYADTDLGMIYYNYRHYNPLDGRWCGRDSEPGNNEYNFARNNAPTLIDVYGNFAALLAAPAAAGTVALLPALGIAVAVIAVGAATIYLGDMALEAYRTRERDIAQTESEREQKRAKRKRCKELKEKKSKAKEAARKRTCKNVPCLEESVCRFIAESIKRFEDVIRARDQYDRECFGGSDDGHQKQLKDLSNGLKKCKELYLKCLQMT